MGRQGDNQTSVWRFALPYLTRLCHATQADKTSHTCTVLLHRANGPTLKMAEELREREEAALIFEPALNPASLQMADELDRSGTHLGRAARDSCAAGGTFGRCCRFLLRASDPIALHAAGLTTCTSVRSARSSYRLRATG